MIYICATRKQGIVIPTYLSLHQVMPVFLTHQKVLGTLEVYSHRICEDLRWKQSSHDYHMLRYVT